MRGPTRIPVYGMARSHLSGVQSTPRIMRGAPVTRPVHVELALTDKRRAASIFKQQGRVQSDDFGSLQGSTLGDDIEMPEECVRPGEVLISPGVCGPPASVSPVTTRVPVTATTAAAAQPASKMSPQLLVLGAICVGAILYFGRK